MRQLLFAAALFSVCSCNSSSKKVKTESMDDTARMEKPVEAGSINPLQITAADLPKGLITSGAMQEAWKWNDQAGENILLVNQVPPYEDKEQGQYGEEGRTTMLYAYQFVKKENEYKNVWTLADSVKGCPFDITSNFIPGSTTITDLDNNGYAEIKLQYMIACRSDVSPAEYKLVMVENGVKRGLYGLSWLPYSPDLVFAVTENNANLEKMGKPASEEDEMIRRFGRYESEKEFTNAAPSFLEYARKEWMKFVKEKMGE